MILIKFFVYFCTQRNSLKVQSINKSNKKRTNQKKTNLNKTK